MTTRPPHPHDSLSDLDLLAGWRAGDRAMGSTLYKRHAERIAGFFRRNLRDRSEVEDLIQETFIALRTSTSTIENVGGFLIGIAFRKFTRYLRKLKGLPELAEGEEDSLEHVAGEITPDPEYVRSQKEETRLLLRAIRRLKLIHQQVLELHLWEEKTGPEIAVILKVPEGTVRSRLKHGQAQLDAKVRELAETDAAYRTTTTSIEVWRERLRRELEGAPPDEDPKPTK